MSNSSDDKRRTILVSRGRSGSSLMCHILTKAGADFGSTGSDSWDERAGSYELTEQRRAAQHFLESLKFKHKLHKLSSNSLRRRYHLLQARRNLDKCLKSVLYLKTGEPALTRLARKLDYSPQVIFLTRNFRSYAQSGFLRSGRSFQTLEESYVDLYKTTLVTLSIYGGCVIRFEDILDLGQDEWAATVEQTTGLDASKLLSVRKEVIKPRETDREVDFLRLSPRMAELESHINELANQVFVPSRLAARRP